VRPGETLTLVAGGTILEVAVLAVDRGQVTVAVQSRHPVPPPSCRLTLALGMPKGKKLEQVAKRAVELGVHNIVPVYTRRSVPRPGRGDGRDKRLAAIVLEAAQQSGRCEVPTIQAPIGFDELLSDPLNGAGIVLWERELQCNLLTMLEPPPQALTLLVGPEGGLAEEEVSALRDKGYHTAGLGPHILRTETACVAALAVVATALWRP